jgi:threonine dehydrogenase-like Zn-dependent dehydrogenase
VRLLRAEVDDGVLTMRLARAIGTRDVHGVEIVSSRAKLARERGVDVRPNDLRNG